MARLPLPGGGLEPEKKPSRLVVATLKQLESPHTVLLKVTNRVGVLLSITKHGKFQAQRVPTERITHMVKFGYVLEKRVSPFSELGWLEYDLTYDGVMHIRNYGKRKPEDDEGV